MAVLITSLRLAVVTLVLTGVLYPLSVTALAGLFFSASAGGSLVRDQDGAVVGSHLVGQRFSARGYLAGRPSAAGAQGYDASASSGSNLGPSSSALRARALADAERLRRENPDASAPVPLELVAASASGLDPHVSPAAALWQVPRIARARGVDADRVRAVVEARIEGRSLGLLGEPRVNVLLVNLALDRQFGGPSADGPVALPSR